MQSFIHKREKLIAYNEKHLIKYLFGIDKLQCLKIGAGYCQQ